jgi:hypothetical protein
MRAHQLITRLLPAVAVAVAVAFASAAAHALPAGASKTAPRRRK